jgi:hypothetical protein
MPLTIDTKNRRYDLVKHVEIKIGEDKVSLNFSKAISTGQARNLALHYVNIFTGHESTFVANEEKKKDPVTVEQPAKDDEITPCVSSQVYRHKKRGSTYRVFAEGSLQVEDGVVLKDGDTLKVYIGEDGKVWIREVSEFNDGRFEKIEAGQVVASIPALYGEKRPFTNFVVSLGIPIKDTSEELRQLLTAARHWYDTATDEEKLAMLDAQKKAMAGGQFGPTDGMGTVVNKH